MAVACAGQLLLLTQPADGPVPEPSILGSIALTEVLTDDDTKLVCPPSLSAAELCMFRGLKASFLPSTIGSVHNFDVERFFC